MRFEGVTHYTMGTAHVPVYFANGVETCFNCDFCRRDSVGRDKCVLTHELLMFSHTERGQRCPIEMVKEDE